MLVFGVTLLPHGHLFKFSVDLRHVNNQYSGATAYVSQANMDIPALPRHFVALVFTRMVSACLPCIDGGSKSKGPGLDRDSQKAAAAASRSGRVIGPAKGTGTEIVRRFHFHSVTRVNTPISTECRLGSASARASCQISVAGHHNFVQRFESTPSFTEG